MTADLLDLLDALLVIAFYAGLGGVTYFGFVLGARAVDAHQRGIDRVHSDRKTP